jgi:F-type H+-transporting ATPase subunit b
MTPPNLSLIFIMVCFWVTLWIVYRFLIRPVGRVIAERQRRTDGAQREWSAKNEEYLAAVSQVEDEIAQAAKDSSHMRAEARQGAMDRRQETLDHARADADERLNAALETLKGEAESARSDLRGRAEELARLLADRLLGREIAS